MQKKLYKYFLSSLLLVLLASSTAWSQHPVFSLGSAGNVSASTVTIPVTASGFSQILAWQGSVNWDNSKLNYASVSSPVSQLTGMQFSASVSSNTGRLSFIWVDNSLNPQSLPDSTVIFNITFNVVNGATGNSGLNFSGNPTALLVSNAGGSPITNAVFQNGIVSFPGVSIAPMFSIGSATGINTSTVAIPVTVKNFAHLLAWQGSIQWNNSKVTFNSISDTSNYINGIAFTSSVSGTTGRLSFVWTENSLVPQTIPDNTVLFNIVFNVPAGANGVSDVLFANAPTPLMLSDANGIAVNNVEYKKGTVAFPGADLPPEFIIGSVYDLSTPTVTVPVTTKNFTDLLGFQGSVNWDNAKLSYLNVTGMHSTLNGIMFHPSASSGIGRLSFLWADGNMTPRSLPDTSVLFNIVFNTVDSVGTTSLEFTSSPTSLIVSDASSANIANVVYTSGITTFSKNVCPGGNGNTTITSNITGINYQWQEKTDSTNFVNVTDTAYYENFNGVTLTLKNIPPNWSGKKYRCLVNGYSSNVFTLRFRDYWVGGNGSWNNPANWGCPLTLPDGHTDVIINGGNVVLNINTTVNAVTLGNGANLVIEPGKTLNITGK